MKYLDYKVFPSDDVTISVKDDEVKKLNARFSSLHNDKQLEALEMFI